MKKQFANVTKRKHEDDENEDPSKRMKRARHHSQGLDSILEHMSGWNVEVKTSILSNFIDTQGVVVAEGAAKDSTELQRTNKLSKEQTAALISGSNMSDYQVKQLRTECNKELGNNPFASARKVAQVRNEILPISREDWETNYVDLYRNKTDKNTDKQKRTCVLNVKNLKTYIAKIANIE